MAAVKKAEAGIRKPWVGGNWKCNGTTDEVHKLIEDFTANIKPLTAKVDVVLCPSPVYVAKVAETVPSSVACAQNINTSRKFGAYTGETTAELLKASGVTQTLVGHSERRAKFGDSDEVVAEKVAICQEVGLLSVVCVGEQLEEREANKTIEVVTRQMQAVIPKITDWSKVVIAYEPVWAIGTGKVATPEQAQEAHAAIRSLLQTKVSEDVAKTTRIVYGGSVTDANSATLIGQKDVDGFLVGGASLKPAFAKIVQSCFDVCA